MIIVAECLKEADGPLDRIIERFGRGGKMSAIKGGPGSVWLTILENNQPK